MPLTGKQKKIAVVAEPRDKITGADFEALRNSKMGGGMVKYAEGGDVREEQLKQLLEDAREKGDDDMIIEIMGDLKQMGVEGFMGGGMVEDRGRVRRFERGMSVSANPMKGRGCGAAVKGRSYSGTY
tara:strand:+ start:1032 stop:1412 length:381 start_codon:yes stop_codon:yes gene_type:complete